MPKKNAKGEEALPPLEGFVDLDDIVGSIERMHPDRIVSFGMWHKHRTGYKGTAQTCVSNRRWVDTCAVEMRGPDEIPDYFSISAENVVAGHTFSRNANWDASCKRLLKDASDWKPGGELLVPWEYISQMMINPRQELNGYNRARGDNYWDKRSTWGYMTAFFETTPLVLYFHIWPSETRKFYADVRAGEEKEKDHVAPRR